MRRSTEGGASSREVASWGVGDPESGVPLWPPIFFKARPRSGPVSRAEAISLSASSHRLAQIRTLLVPPPVYCSREGCRQRLAALLGLARAMTLFIYVGFEGIPTWRLDTHWGDPFPKVVKPGFG